MSSEMEDQGHPEIIAEKGIAEKKEKRLSLEAEKLIREFMIKWVSLPAIFLAVISFALGFFIEKVAFQTASNQAFQSSQSEVMKLIQHVMDAKHKADTAAAAIETSSKEIKQSEEKAKKFADELSYLQSKVDSTVAFQATDIQIKKIAGVLSQDPRITRVLNDLDTSIQTRLAAADGEIEKIKATYKIDCQEGKITGLLNYKKVFDFPFPVKHAWIQSVGNLGEPYRLTPEIKDNTVTVTAKQTDLLYYPSADKQLRRMSSPFVYHVWATSF